MAIPKHLQQQEQLINDSEASATEDFEKFANKQTLTQWVFSALLFGFGIFVLVASVLVYSMILTDAAERTLFSSCLFDCGFTDRKTLAQTILK
jgi:hypothetical protein